MGNTIKIHKELPAKLARNPGLLKAMAVFYGLKFLYVGGIIVDITGRYGEIASRLGISPNNLRGKIKTLEKLGLARKTGRNITFAGFKEIGKVFETKSRKSFRLAHKETPKLEILIKALAIENNLERQRHKVREKIVNEELKRYGKIEAKTIRNKIKRYIRKNMSFYAEKHNKRVSYSASVTSNKKKLNTTTTVSRAGIAEIMGRVSKSTGSRLVRKMYSLNILERDEKRISLVSNKTDRLVTKYMELDSSYFVFKNKLYKRESNLIAFNNFFA